MKKITKLALRGFLLGGFFYASVMAGWDYYQGEDFDIVSCMSHFFWMGCCGVCFQVGNFETEYKKNQNEKSQ
ncbi:MAG: hypothetical protein WA951_12370 [Leeuwenhoekiella sp.]